MKKYIFLLLIFTLVSCNNTPVDKSNTDVENSNNTWEVIDAIDEEEKEVTNTWEIIWKLDEIEELDENYRWENVEKLFKEISRLYDEGKYSEVSELIDNLVENNKWIKTVEDFINDNDIWKEYTKWELWEKKWPDSLEEEFKEIHVLYEEKKYNEVKKRLDVLEKRKDESEWVKDFLENTQIGKEYVLWNLGVDLLWEQFKELHALYETKKYEEIKDILDELVKRKEEVESIKDFFENTQIGKEYLEWNLGVDLLWKQLENVDVLYSSWSFEEVKNILDELVKRKDENAWLKDFFENTDVGKEYLEWKLWDIN